ncbi:MAG: substrate-binding periplasmic protein [Psychrobium sp.]
MLLLSALTAIGINSALEMQEKCVINTAWFPRPPYQYLNQRRKPDGFDIQFIQAIGKKLNCTVNVVQRNWGRQDSFAVEGRQDIILGSMDWDENVDYYVSDAYRSDPVGAYWNGPIANEDIEKGLTQLLNEGYKFAFRRYLHENEEFEKVLSSPRFKRQILSVDNDFGVISHLKKGRIKGAFLHLATAEEFLKSHGRDNIYFNKKLSYDNPASLLLAINSPLGQEFLERLNKAIEALKADGTIKKLEEKYLNGYTIDSVK